MTITRMPTQERSIEKRNRIIKTGFDLFCEKGYHNISTNEIAKKAGVSVGIIYQYFENKHDILLESMNYYSDSIMYPTLDSFENVDLSTNNLKEVLTNIVDYFIEHHTMKKEVHEELLALQYEDEEIGEIFKRKELHTVNVVCEILKRNGYKNKNLLEKVHISYNLIDNLCHDIIYHKHEDINYDEMKKEVISIVENLLKK